MWIFFMPLPLELSYGQVLVHIVTCQQGCCCAVPATDEGGQEKAEAAVEDEAQGVSTRPKRSLRLSTRTCAPEWVK